MVSTPEKHKKQKHKKIFEENAETPEYLRKIELKAKQILIKEEPIKSINDNLLFVRSETVENGWYKVQWNGKDYVCSCPDFIKNGHIRECKHLVAIRLRYDEDFNPADENIIIPENKTYPQDWSKYNQAQTHEFELFDKYLIQLVSCIEEPEQHMGRPRIRLQDQVFCSVMKVYSQLSSRRAKWLYHEAVQRQQINLAPHFNVVSKALNKKELTPILHKLVRLSAKPLAGIESDFAVDSSGFRCSSFGHYCEEKHRTKHWRNWLKVHICTGVNTNIVTDVAITDEHASDSKQFPKLVRNTSRFFDIEEVSADKAYSSRKNLDLIGQYNGEAYIPFKRNATGTSKGSKLWNQAFHYFQLHRDEFLAHYHKRSNVESTFGAIKMKFGETLKSRNRTAQVNEMLCKIIAYNITVLIHEMIQLDGSAEFLSIDGLKREENLNNRMDMKY